MDQKDIIVATFYKRLLKINYKPRRIFTEIFVEIKSRLQRNN